MQFNINTFADVTELQGILNLLKAASSGTTFNKEDVKPVKAMLQRLPQLKKSEAGRAMKSYLPSGIE